jgi:acetaldehyde dehydrogenase (acetylating)
MDSDLISIQEARDLAANAQEAQRLWAKASQIDVDRVCAAMAQAAFNASGRLGQMAHDETGFGVPEHKKLKNEFGSMAVWESIKDIRTAGVINVDSVRGVTEIAWPAGVVAALTPSTNPTSTVMFKILISVKARDGIVVAPHPSAVNCCAETVRIMARAAVDTGAPRGLISCLEHVSLAGTQELMILLVNLHMASAPGMFRCM